MNANLRLVFVSIWLTHNAIANEFTSAATDAQRSTSSYLGALISQAHKLRLSSDPMWNALLHYKISFLWGTESEVDGGDFFLADNGKFDPQSELDATLASFFSTQQIAPTHNVSQCRFVARYRWLKSRLNFDPQLLKEQTCDDFALYMRLLAPESLTVVFPTAYPGSPSSMFGHTLLRVNKRGWNDQTRMLNYSVNFAAQVPKNVNPFTYAASGLGGGFQGRFTVLPYYTKLREYAQMENRDIWEYELNLSPEKIETVVEHIYELGTTYFDYYFLTENCSYHLLSLLDVAFPEKPLTDEFKYWTKPTDTLRVLEARNLVSKVSFFPSNSRIIEVKQELLSTQDRQLAANLVKNNSNQALETLSLDRQVAVLDLAHDYYRYTKLKNTEMSDGSLDDKERTLLTRRAKMHFASPMVDIAPPTIRPDFGNHTTRIGLAIGREGGDNVVSLSWRAAYHSLLDASTGYDTNASLQFGNVVASILPAKAQAQIDSVTFFDILSLEPVKSFFRNYSWGVHTGWRRHYLALSDTSGAVFGNAKAGFTLRVQSNSDRTLIYSLLEGELGAGEALKKRYRLAFGPRVGLVSEPLRQWRLSINAYYSAGVIGDDRALFNTSFDQTYAFFKDVSASLSVTQQILPQKTLSTMLGVLYYF